jgi:signal transduction histidine kinase
MRVWPEEPARPARPADFTARAEVARSGEEVIMAPIDDPWQARLNRMRQVLPLPLLAVSAAITLAVPGSASHRWARLELGLPLTAAAAALWVVATVRLGGDPSSRWRLPVFAAHTALAAVLVWVDPAYGIFAYLGFLYSYGLGARWRLAGFTATALIVSAGISGGYPDRDTGHTLSYLLIAAVLVALVFTTAQITTRAVDQNIERGQMITELAEANRRLAASMDENSRLHAQLVTQAREAGVTEERQRLAGEIHDTLAQGLTGIIAQLEAAEHTRTDPGELSRHLAQAAGLARSSLTEARRSVRALRPEQLEDASLPEALGELTRSWSGQTGVAAALDITGTPVRAGADVEAAVFRAAQEALSNVAKHAQAGRVQLTLSYAGDTLLLDVADDGSGFDPAVVPNHDGGYGLTGMEQRLGRVGGTLTVESAREVGTTINAAVPLPGPGSLPGPVPPTGELR